MSGMSVPTTAFLAGVLMVASAVYGEPASDAAQRRIERKCSSYDTDVIHDTRKRIADALSSGKSKTEVWKAERSSIKSQRDVPSEFIHCAKAIFDVEYLPYKKAEQRRRRQQERDEHSEWYALTTEKQTMILKWRKATAARQEPDIPVLQFTKWAELGHPCDPLEWTITKHETGDFGIANELLRVSTIIDANTMIVSVGSHQTKCSSYRARTPSSPMRQVLVYNRRHSYEHYDAEVTRIVVVGVSTNGLVPNVDLDGDRWGFMRVTRVTTEFGEPMYVLKSTGDSPGTLMAIPVPPRVLKEDGL